MQGDVIAMVTKTGGEKEDLELVETPDRMLPVIWTEMIGDSPRTSDYKAMSARGHVCKPSRRGPLLSRVLRDLPGSGAFAVQPQFLQELSGALLGARGHS